MSSNFALPFCYNAPFGKGAIPGQEFRTREFHTTFFQLLLFLERVAIILSVFLCLDWYQFIGRINVVRLFEQRTKFNCLSNFLGEKEKELDRGRLGRKLVGFPCTSLELSLTLTHVLTKQEKKKETERRRRLCCDWSANCCTSYILIVFNWFEI